MKGNAPEKGVVIATALGASLLAMTAYAAISEVIAVGTMAHSDLVGGPATVTTRRLTIASGEVLGWHYHPGAGAYTIVTRGRLFVEDGCGGEEVFTTGQAFLEPPNRVHRGKNQDVEPTETLQTFIVPTGLPISVSTPQLCGPPAVVQDCRGNEWMKFNHPQRFRNQGDCVFYVAARGVQ
jgi:quercetin dioxygenase-like cupin family protein